MKSGFSLVSLLTLIAVIGMLMTFMALVAPMPAKAGGPGNWTYQPSDLNGANNIQSYIDLYEADVDTNRHGVAFLATVLVPGTTTAPTQSVGSVALYVNEPVGGITQNVASAANSGQLVIFLNNAATNVVFLETAGYMNLSQSSITQGVGDVLGLLSYGTNWHEAFHTDN